MKKAYKINNGLTSLDHALKSYSTQPYRSSSGMSGAFSNSKIEELP